ncbi:MAG: hypothetical protein A2046_00385 [Bacteroidetes bacterium GWA2_30_7]|nr:MAG: hypothetical protein A2046_00385 [Bacteroidetes bacterium GWA2_30_7]
MKKIVTLLTTILIIGFLFNSCKKKTEEEPEPEPVKPTQDLTTQKNASADAMETEAYSNDVYSNVFSGESESSNKGTLVCATVTLVPGALNPTYPKILTIDFGTTPCTGTDGKARSGKIIATLSDKIRNMGATIDISLENYKVDTVAISGTFKLTNDSGSTGSLTFTYTVTNMVLTVPSGTISNNSTKTFSWTQGESTPLNVNDDVYSVTGSNTFVNLDGKTYKLDILTSLDFKVSCAELVKGTAKLTIPDLPIVTLDFGNGDCDGVGTLSTDLVVLGQTYTYTETFPLP